ncbi:hypothetical protein SAMN04488072_104238 [Lentibacillus halodurans]|uniref:Uncharacterized protein n=1 Tax=Lentibacillus halodurans TaxID=237679 RepID=A0A1I0XBA9_9BACI|nr:hypothetical protein SAMN04488072_104238 [Lentibacillus halodurans]
MKVGICFELGLISCFFGGSCAIQPLIVRCGPSVGGFKYGARSLRGVLARFADQNPLNTQQLTRFGKYRIYYNHIKRGLSE